MVDAEKTPEISANMVYVEAYYAIYLWYPDSGATHHVTSTTSNVHMIKNY